MSKLIHLKRYTLDTINAELEMNKNGSTLNPSSNQFDGRLFYLSKQVPHYFTITL